ncbi:MAG TPA: VOC family protein [Mycobacteriales bacterium]|jgi:catechol 2,3-dioxygenase-like lactoylglutathione lyase family enzyme|nr:VOC family protein [Mycobacteriales bacterium]
MIDRIGLVCIWVYDQDEALDFYVGKLGFALQTDVREDGVRFVLVTAPLQPEVPLMLAVPGPPAMDQATADELRNLVAKGFLGPGSLVTRDCRGTTAELKALGVEFVDEPEDRFYGIDAGFRDPFGNHWRLTELTPPPA